MTIKTLLCAILLFFLPAHAEEKTPVVPQTEFELAVHSFAQSISIPLNTDLLNRPWVKTRELYINDGGGSTTVVVFGRSLREDNAWIGFVARIRPDVAGLAMTVRFEPINEPSIEALAKIDSAWDGLLDKELPRGRFTGPDAAWRLYSRQGARANLNAEFGFGPGADTTRQRARFDALLEALGVAKAVR